jgi:hypothetical protein
MTLALALDDLLRHPDAAAIAADADADARAAGQGWLIDQASAAANDTHRILTAIADATANGQIHPMTAAQHPDWVRLGMLATLATWIKGTGSTCIHNPKPTRPQPVLSAAWKPGLVVCAHCTPLLRLPRGSIQDRTCDGCGTVITDGARLYSSIAALGMFAYHIGACEPCRYWPDDTQPSTHTTPHIPRPRARAARRRPPQR